MLAFELCFVEASACKPARSSDWSESAAGRSAAQRCAQRGNERPGRVYGPRGLESRAARAWRLGGRRCNRTLPFSKGFYGVLHLVIGMVAQVDRLDVRLAP